MDSAKASPMISTELIFPLASGWRATAYTALDVANPIIAPAAAQGSNAIAAANAVIFCSS